MKRVANSRIQAEPIRRIGQAEPLGAQFARLVYSDASIGPLRL